MEFINNLNSLDVEERKELVSWFSKLKEYEQLIVVNELVSVGCNTHHIREILHISEPERFAALLRRNIFIRYIVAPSVYEFLLTSSAFPPDRRDDQIGFAQALTHISKECIKEVAFPPSTPPWRYYLYKSKWFEQVDFGTNTSESNELDSIPKRNHLVADDIVRLIKIAFSAGGAIKVIVELIKAWVEDRKGRKIRLKRHDFELEIQGGMADKEIEERIKQFIKILKDSDNDINIIVP